MNIDEVDIDDVETWTLEQWDQWQGAVVVRALSKLVPIVGRSDDKQLQADFQIMIFAIKQRYKIVPKYLASLEGGQKGIANRWSEQTNAVRYKAQITLAKNLKATWATRDHIIDTVLIEMPSSFRVKPNAKKRLMRILRDNNALPAARKKKENG